MLLADLIFGACLVVFVLAAAQLVWDIVRLSRFDVAVRALSPSRLPEPHHFTGRSALDASANRYLASFRKAVDKGLIAAFRVEERIGEVAAQLRSMSAWPRSIVGLLILGSLLVTLFNLQVSVAQLGEAFHDLSRGNAQEGSAAAPPSGDDKAGRVQEAMGEIAGAARSAFGRSGVIIFLAVLILVLTLTVQHSAANTSRHFTTYAHNACDEALAAQAPRDPATHLADLGKLISQLHEVTSAFEDMNTGLSAVAEFGLKLESSSQQIADAVSRLPDNVKTSFVGLSSEVTRHIAEDLQGQLEYLKRIALIYGDQELRLREVREFLAQSTAEARRAADALASLAPLPAGMDKLSAILEVLARNTVALEHTVAQLDEKVNLIPVLDLKAVAGDLHGAVAALTRSEEAVHTSARAASALRGEMAKDLERIAEQNRNLAGEMAAAVSRGNESLAAYLGRLESAAGASARQVSELLAGLKQAQAADRKVEERSFEVAAHLATLETELRDLSEYARRPFWQKTIEQLRELRRRTRE